MRVSVKKLPCAHAVKEQSRYSRASVADVAGLVAQDVSRRTDRRERRGQIQIIGKRERDD
jgi:hypothetical protein